MTMIPVEKFTHSSTDNALYLHPIDPINIATAREHFGVHLNSEEQPKCERIEMEEERFYDLPEFEG